MACNCKSDIEAKLMTFTQENTPDSSLVEVKLEGYGYTFGAGVSERPYMPYKAQYCIPKKDGTQRSIKKTGSMFFTYCPFCGTTLQSALGGPTT
jgi:hypothetical protein